MKHTYRTSLMISIGIAILAICVYLLLFGGSAAAPSKPSQQTVPATISPDNAVATNRVTIQNYQFDPSVIRIHKNRTVIWTNNDTAAHSVSLDINGQKTVSSVLNLGGSFSFVFDQAGTFTYHDGENTDETATILVTDD